MKWLLGPIVAEPDAATAAVTTTAARAGRVGAAVRVEVEPAALLDALELGRVDPEPVDGEVAPSAAQRTTSSAVRSRR